MGDTLENLIMRCIERFMASRFSERHGLVTSYDPDKHLAKVMFQPEGQESGWIPIETGHIGNGYGIATGLTPGNGGAKGNVGSQGSSPAGGGGDSGGGGGGGGGEGGQGQQEATGDQVIVRYQENDFEGGKIVQRVHSSKDKPPKVEAGESVVWTQWGQQVFFKKNGEIVLIDGKGGSIRTDGGGNAIGRHKQDTNSYAVDDHHTHIKFGSAAIWVDGGGCWSTVPIRRANCSDNFKGDGEGAKAGGQGGQSGGGGSGGSGGGGG
jgi:hypothetical protein